ncbi:MAG: DUF6912 family protein [Nocardioides sp.]|uniref:DUF6912 family protein n=1 Tax=Nocardioides sp. TaxID=35761 RepID=UPI003F0D8A5C
MSARRYLPSTVHELAAALAVGSLPVPAGVVVAADESEDAEYDALMTAADASAERVRGAGDGLRRRVVVVTAVELDPLPLDRVLSVHLDDADDADPDDDLGWYATQELAEVLAGH